MQELRFRKSSHEKQSVLQQAAVAVVAGNQSAAQESEKLPMLQLPAANKAPVAASVLSSPLTRGALPLCCDSWCRCAHICKPLALTPVVP